MRDAAAREKLSPPSYIENATVLSALLRDTKVSFDEKFTAFTAADKNTRLYVGAWYSAAYQFYYPLQNYPTKAIEFLITDYAKEALAENPNPDAKPARPSKPQPRNYEGGEEDPAYIADFEVWLITEEIYQTWYTNDQMYRVAFENEAFQQILAVAPEYENFWNITNQMLDAKMAYDRGEDAKTLAADALDAYDALSDFDKLLIEKYTKYIYYYPVDRITSWTYDYKRPSTLVTACQDICNEELLFDFIDIVNNISLPYTKRRY